MTDKDWSSGFGKSLAVFLNGHAIPDLDRRGQEVKDDSFFLLFNAWDQNLHFVLPGPKWGRRWEMMLDTALPLPPDRGVEYKAGDTVPLCGRNVVVLTRP
jgi:glycogen operon protein